MSRAEGQAFAKRHGCLFVETSAKANVAVGQAFEELVMKVRMLLLAQRLLWWLTLASLPLGLY